MGFDITGLGSLFDLGGKIIDKIFPDKDAADKAKLEMFKLQQEGAFKEMDQQFQLSLEQMKVNAVEAANPSIFVSGWRPAVGWVCVSAYAFNYIIMPLFNWVSKFFIANAPTIVALDTGELTTLLFGMLGIGTLRTIDKIKGTASK
jgi:hypothetical protein